LTRLVLFLWEVVMIDPGLAGRVAVVTGANHGIGAVIAQTLAAQGGRVLVHYYRVTPPEGAPVDAAAPPGEARYNAHRDTDAAAVIAAIQAAGGEAVAWQADLSDPAAVPALFDRAEAAFGPVEILVNNAAHWEADTFIPAGQALSNDLPDLWASGLVGGFDTGKHDRVFAVNTRAVALLMAEFARRHVARGADRGRIINLSTDGAYCFPSEVSYGASKLALEGYSRSAARELGQFGITVNVISPGPIQTDWISPELEAALLPSIPLGRIGYPDDIADVAVFLASDQARWLTGQTLHVGGGHAM
jgi:3-oxoacyl-[acyl-carrier protein] reductase